MEQGQEGEAGASGGPRAVERQQSVQEEHCSRACKLPIAEFPGMLSEQHCSALGGMSCKARIRETA